MPSKLRLAVALLLGQASLLAARDSAWSDDDRAGAVTQRSSLYRREATSIDEAVQTLICDAQTHHPECVLVVFDTITFNPPPGTSEYSSGGPPRTDVSAWLTAIKASAARLRTTVFVAASESEKIAALDSATPSNVAVDTLSPSWWNAPPARRFRNFSETLARLVPLCKSASTTIILITGELLPESTTPSNAKDDELWRDRLLRRGDYWNEETLISTLRSSRARLVIVGPEARFGDFRPASDLPEAPWAARPHVPEEAPSDGVAGVSSNSDGSPCRFAATVPHFYRPAGIRYFNTDCPSGYGFWPYARVAAATGGIYVFYPRANTGWRDVCIRDDKVVDALAPELIGRREWAARRGQDDLFRLLMRAMALVEPDANWAIEGNGGWCAFDSTAPFALDEDFQERDKPFGSESGCIGFAGSLAEPIRRLTKSIDHYDEAISLLDEAERLANERGAPARDTRTLADVRLCRFWFEMSAFHLEALRKCLSDAEDDAHTGDRNSAFWKQHRLGLQYVSCIRLSDCLPGYDERRVSDDDESRLSVPRQTLGPEHEHQIGMVQSNFLDVPCSDARYRARRSVDAVLAKVDRHLQVRARRMITAAESVMRWYSRSGWGWMVYYSEANTFIIIPTDLESGAQVIGTVGVMSDTRVRPPASVSGP